MADPRFNILNHAVESNIYTAHTVFYYGEQISVVVSNDRGTVANWITETERIYGLDHTFHNQVIVIELLFEAGFWFSQTIIPSLQLCIGHRCLIYPLNLLHRHAPPELLNFLNDHSAITLRKHSMIQALCWFWQIDYFDPINHDHDNILELDMLIGLWEGNRVFQSRDLNELANLILHRDTIPMMSVMVRISIEGLHLPTSAQVLYATVNAYTISQIGGFLLRYFWSNPAHTRNL